MPTRSTHASKKRRGRARLLLLIGVVMGLSLLLTIPFLLHLEIGGPSNHATLEPSGPDRVLSPRPAHPVPLASTPNPTTLYQQTVAVIYTQQAQDAVSIATKIRRQALDATTTAQKQGPAVTI